MRVQAINNTIVNINSRQIKNKVISQTGTIDKPVSDVVCGTKYSFSRIT